MRRVLPQTQLMVIKSLQNPKWVFSSKSNHDPSIYVWVCMYKYQYRYKDLHRWYREIYASYDSIIDQDPVINKSMDYRPHNLTTQRKHGKKCIRILTDYKSLLLHETLPQTKCKNP